MMELSHKTVIKPRYYETDQMGVVHHSVYYHWFEIGRCELCEAWGAPYREWEAAGVSLPVVESHCSYRRPALFDIPYLLTTQLTELKSYTITFAYHLNDGEKELAHGSTVHAVVGKNGRILRGEHPFYTPLQKKIQLILSQSAFQSCQNKKIRP